LPVMKRFQILWLLLVMDLDAHLWKRQKKHVIIIEDMTISKQIGDNIYYLATFYTRLMISQPTSWEPKIKRHLGNLVPVRLKENKHLQQKILIEGSFCIKIGIFEVVTKRQYMLVHSVKS